METMQAFIMENIDILVLVSLIMNIILILLLVFNFSNVASIKKKFKKLTKGMTGKNIEDILLEHISRIDGVREDFEGIHAKINLLENRISFGIQKVGFIRYNAFSDVGSDLSYSIALLDENDDGFILTGIHGRAESYTYAKSISNGVSNYHLSVEEEQALERSKKNHLDTVQMKPARRNK